MATYTSAKRDASVAGLTTGSTLILPADTGRQSVVIQNVGAQTAWINFGAPATAAAGSFKLIAGASLVFGEGDGAWVPSDLICARSDSATTDLTVWYT